MQSVCADLVLQMGWERGAGPGRAGPGRAGQGLTQRLSACLRQAISERVLEPGSRLPASRDLARELQVARNTVSNAYEQLRIEGYVQARVGSGTFVADAAPEQLLHAPRLSGRQRALASEPYPQPLVRLADRAQRVLAQASAAPQQWGAFMPGVPDVSEFPREVYARILNRLWRHAPPQMLTYGTQAHVTALQKALAAHLRVARSVQCQPEQILITEGVHQAIDLAARVLVNPGEHVWMEEPGYWGIANVLRMSEGIAIHGMKVDGEGMVLEPQAPVPSLICTTPSHQYPLGSVMSLARRKALLAYARKVGAWIVEDDYDSEFRFSGSPVPSMQGLELNAPVIYVGTFSKTLFPGLRVGYMVLPQGLVEPMQRMHAEMYREGHQITHQALAELMEGGHYAAHIRRMRVLYARRREHLLQLVQRYLGDEFMPGHDSQAGLHLVLPLPAHVDDQLLTKRLSEAGVLARPLSQYYVGPDARKGLLLGYASVSEAQMQLAFFTLVQVLRKQLAPTA
ncbi:MocR-like pyridoxine biosynthesis transcription factor PdxR [Acidovorax bellezanensis]|uniref:MocR-like pyridoxine biosynthesis transcription factor PdxR n=1 Tax=Acidovorax bellezanensis TaxID=2976702 RepID=UPI0021C1DAC4|nr:PLP-dependent aminotransferase family protein [Acidovorax sp. Be4]